MSEQITESVVANGGATVRCKMPWWVRTLAIVGIVILVLAIVFGALVAKTKVFAANYYDEIPDHITWKSASAEQPLRANGRGIYDHAGNRVKLQGINFGNWLITEAWMCTHGVGPTLDKDGGYANVNEDGIVEGYKESYYSEELATLAERFGADKAAELVKVYQDNYIQEADFVNVKNIGFNVIRLPMYFGNFMQQGDDGKWTMKSDWYTRLDWFLDQCKANDLYAILDMHGVLGGQSGYEHSGTRSIDFWSNTEYQDTMATLWATIAERYATTRRDLSQTIAAYDLINEPVDRNTPGTTRKQAEVMDKLYKAVRAVDVDNHIVSVEFCWMLGSCLDPSLFGWDNVMYQVHMYNWNNQIITYEMFYLAQDLTHSFSAYNVPMFIGEFTFFDNKEHWAQWLAEYDRRGYGWTVWSYKAASVGYWDTSWGLYVDQMNLGDGQLKTDVTKDSYEQILDCWSKVGTGNAANRGGYDKTGVLYEVMQTYFGK